MGVGGGPSRARAEGFYGGSPRQMVEPRRGVHAMNRPQDLPGQAGGDAGVAIDVDPIFPGS